jgi:hypothetical protein
MLFEIIFFIIILWILLSVVFWSIRNGIGPMPSSKPAKICLMKSLPPIGKGKIFELGSGWGTLAFPIAHRFPDNIVVGFETSPIPYTFSKLRLWSSPLANLCFEKKDFYIVNFAEADLIVCYLYPGAMRLLKSKLEQELKKGTWVISNTFAIPGWTPQNIYEVEDLYRTKIYLYKT